MTDQPVADPTDRPLRPALIRGLRGRCPACGEGRLFARFLKPVAICDHCSQRWDGHQADDFPAYIVILLLGHLLVPLMIEVNAALAIPLGIQMGLWPGLAILLGAAMIQPAKGAVIAFQWTRRMHGLA
ncbi:DUF983 domain-containing protein [Sphingobium sp. AP49]|uniref:DUF983 domain-containing protein n=1 Tax=Sphingobium sp. AP49 TaxID=1144307 RepID=UPI00026ECB32|nr:DUF983 domain-containing protein [Sphingobium sp. AP49]WHO39905.1 DUF983 domain-containing protein [Sphingobium sp. AP49]